MITYNRLRRFIQNDIPIYKFFFGDFEVNGVYSSPFRKDKNPSFSIRQSEKGNLYWVDYGLSNQQYYDGVGLVMHIYNVSRQEAINAIWTQLVQKKQYKKVNTEQPKVIKKIPYHFEQGYLRDWEIPYWEQHTISENMLSFYNVHSLHGLYREDKLLFSSTPNNPAYIYLWEEDEEAFKSYKPLDPKGDKFRGQRNGLWIQGWHQLPKTADHLFIQSSLKDVMVLRSAGFLSIAPQSENSYKSLLPKVEEINQRFAKVYILFDNDLPGIRAAHTLAKKVRFAWEPIFLPKLWGKDPADFIKKVGNHLRIKEFFSNFGEAKLEWI